MPEEVLFKSESDQSCTDVASYLRTVAERLETGDDITLSGGDDSITLDLPEGVTFEVKVEREGPEGQSGDLSLELELEWPEDAPGEDHDGFAVE